MPESLIDVLIYIYERFMSSEAAVPHDHMLLEEELLDAGFARSEVAKAFGWLDELAWQQEHLAQYAGVQPSEQAMRIYSQAEQAKIGLEIQGLLLTLEQGGILDPLSREVVIERCMAIEVPDLNVNDVQWIVLLVLLNQPGQEWAFSLMEALVYQDEPVFTN